MRRSVLVFLLLLAAGPRLWAASAESRAFDAAYRDFKDTIWDRAETNFAVIAQNFTNSVRLPEAILFQAEARVMRTNYAGALELLRAYQNRAGKWADEYLFWLAETYFRTANYQAAADTFARLGRDFPASPRALEAGVEEAAARLQLQQWPQVIELLAQTNGLFQSVASTNWTDEHVLDGYLLLSKARLGQKDYRAAEATLEPLAKLPLDPARSWQRQYLLCSIQLADGRADEALQNSTNLLALAASAGQRKLLAQSIAFQAGLFERLGRLDEAIAAYSTNLTEGVSAERQRQAFLKIAELALAQNRIADAAQVLERFLAKYTNAPSADQAALSLGELRLRQYLAGPNTNVVAGTGTNAPATTDSLQQAILALQSITSRFPHSSLVGKAQLDLGWCYWLQTNLPASQAAFQAAVERLPVSPEPLAALDRAIAYFKLADTQFRQTNFDAAIANYSAVTNKFADLDEVKTNLLQPALYQVVLAGQAAGNLPATTNALSKILAWFPDGFYAARALLVSGQEVGRQNPALAQAMFSDFVRDHPADPLRPEVELAIARTYEQEGRWLQAIDQYDHWLATFTNHLAQASAEYFRARANFMARRETNAFALYTNFVARYPTNEFTPLAQWWIADFYYQSGKVEDAEKKYKWLFQNLPPTNITYEARLMAGRAAFARQDWPGAIGHFTNLTSDANCPADVRVQALFAYGDSVLSMDPPETNKLVNLQTAIAIFTNICESYPTNSQTARAWGQMASCHLQLRQYEQARLAFEKVIAFPQADLAARSSARVGLALVLEKQAEEETGAEQTALLMQACNHCRDVFNPDDKFLREGESPDPFWAMKALLENVRLLDEKLKQPGKAKRVCQDWQDKFPSLRLQDKIKALDAKAKESLERDVSSIPPI